MNKVDEYVIFKINSSDERKQIIQEYDSWINTGVLAGGVLREHARLLSVFLYGDNARYGPPVGTQMKELYVAVCRFYTNLYLSKE